MSVLMASRNMYNACLQELITHYQETGKYLHLYEQDKRHGKEAHPDLPVMPPTAWITDASKHLESAEVASV